MPGLLTEATVEDIKQAEERLVNELRRRAKRDLSGVSSDEDVHIRDVLPNVDLQSGDDNGWNGTDREWVQSGLSAGSLEEVYTIDASDRMEGKVFGVFAISFASADPLTTEIVFEDGTGSRFERLMVQEAQTMTEGFYALLRNPIIFNEGKDAVVYQWPNSAGQDRVIYHGAIAEKAGTELGTRSQGEQAATGTARQPGRR